MARTSSTRGQVLVCQRAANTASSSLRRSTTSMRPRWYLIKPACWSLPATTVTVVLRTANIWEMKSCVSGRLGLPVRSKAWSNHRARRTRQCAVAVLPEISPTEGETRCLSLDAVAAGVAPRGKPWGRRPPAAEKGQTSRLEVPPKYYASDGPSCLERRGYRARESPAPGHGTER
jgi:hypothetical protein